MTTKSLKPKTPVRIEIEDPADPKFVCEHCGKKHPVAVDICHRCDRSMGDPPSLNQYVRHEQKKLPKFLRGDPPTEEVFDAQYAYETWADEQRRDFLWTRLALRKNAPRYKEPKSKPKKNKKRKTRKLSVQPQSIPLSETYSRWVYGPQPTDPNNYDLYVSPMPELPVYVRKPNPVPAEPGLSWVETWIRAIREAPCLDVMNYIAHVALQLGPHSADRARVLEAAEEQRKLFTVPTTPVANWEI